MNYKFQKKGVVQKYTKTSFLVVAIMMSRRESRKKIRKRPLEFRSFRSLGDYKKYR